MRSVFQQVQAPNLSSSIAGINGANQNIAAGLASISSGLTSLGERRERRNKQRLAVQQAEQLENFKQQLSGATTAEDIAALSGGGTSILGAADALTARQNTVLDQQSSRASTGSVIESTRGARIGNDDKEFDLNSKKDSDKFQKDFGREIIQANSLATQGDDRGAQNSIESIIDRALEKGYGADKITSLIDNAVKQGTAGDEARTSKSRNSLELAGTREGNRATGVQNRQKEAQSALDYRQDKRNDNQAYSQSEYAFNRTKDNDTENDLVTDSISRILGNATSVQDALVTVRDDPNLSDNARFKVASGIQAAADARPDLLNTTNPIDELSENLLIDQANNPQGTNFTAASDFVTGALNAYEKRSPSLQIKSEAQALEQRAEADGGRIDIPSVLEERYPGRINDAKLNEINKIQIDKGLSDAEVVSMVDRALGARGVGLHSILPGGKKTSDRTLDIKKFKKVAKTYSEDISQGNLESRQGEYQRARARADDIASRAQAATTARARAVASGDTTKVAKYDRLLRDLENQANNIETNVLNLEGQNRQRAQSSLNKFLEPEDDFISNIIGQTDLERELRTVRGLR